MSELSTERFLKIWEYSAIELYDRDENNEVNIFEAEDPKHKKLEYVVFFEQRVEITQVAKLYVEVFKQLFNSQPEIFFTTDLVEK